MLLEFDEGMISAEDKENMVYNKQVRNLNDLVYVFKRMLTTQYNLDGYINITEDQGEWDTADAYIPV